VPFVALFVVALFVVALFVALFVCVSSFPLGGGVQATVQRGATVKSAQASQRLSDDVSLLSPMHLSEEA
jgi:Zn-dependent protease